MFYWGKFIQSFFYFFVSFFPPPEERDKYVTMATYFQMKASSNGSVLAHF